MSNEQEVKIKSENRENYLATEKIGKLLVRFGVPAVISLLVNSLYNIVDQIFIGQGVGYLGNAATNVAFPFVTLTMAVALLIGDGCAAHHSLKMGAGDVQKAKEGFGNALSLMIIAGLVIFAIGAIFLSPMLRLFGATDAVMPFALDYTSIILIGLPFVVVGTALNSFIRADGSPVYAMISMLIGAVINTILDPIFIFKFGMGVKGAAIATIIGQIASFLVSIYYIKRIKSIKFEWKDMKLKFSACKIVTSLGVSSFITQIAIALVQIVMNNSLTHYGEMSVYGKEIPLSCLGIVMKVNQIMIAVIVGIAIGAQPIVGFNYGAGNLSRVKKTYLTSVCVASMFSVAAWLAYMFLPHAIISVFGNESALYNEFAIKCFRQFLLCAFIAGMQIVSSNFFQAIGNPLKAAVLSLSRQVLFLIPLMLILPLFMELEGILYAGPIADSMSFVLAFVMIGFEMRKLNKLENQKVKTVG